MIFECLDCSFCPVASVQSCRRKLVIDVFICHEILEELGCFVVETMELGTEASSLEKTENFFVGVLDGFLFAIGDRFSVNGVAIIIVKDKDVIVSGCGGYDEAACLIGTDLSCYCLAFGVNMVSAMPRSFLI